MDNQLVQHAMNGMDLMSVAEPDSCFPIFLGHLEKSNINLAENS